MIIVDNIPQGSFEWLKARLHRLTASEFYKVLTSEGVLSKSEAARNHILGLCAAVQISDEYLEKCAELDDWKLKKALCHYTGDSFAGNVHTERGHEFEPEAVAKVAEKHGVDLQPVDMVIMGDSPDGVISCSPDAWAHDERIGCEAKNPTLKGFFEVLHNDEVDPKHVLQVHGSMAVCEVDHWIYCSHFTGYPVFSKVVERNDLTNRIEDSLHEARDWYEELLLETYERLDQIEKPIEAIIPQQQIEDIL